jgi:hypothetical protein
MPDDLSGLIGRRESDLSGSTDSKEHAGVTPFFLGQHETLAPGDSTRVGDLAAIQRGAGISAAVWRDFQLV